MRITTILILTATLALGCAGRVVGRPFEFESAQQIAVGMAAPEVRELLKAEPAITSVGGAAPHEQWSYYYAERRRLTVREVLQAPVVEVFWFLPWPLKHLGRRYSCKVQFVNGGVTHFEFSSNEAFLTRVGF